MADGEAWIHRHVGNLLNLARFSDLTSLKLDETEILGTSKLSYGFHATG